MNFIELVTYAMAVLPVPGWPPINIALPAILPSLIILRITPAALLALAYKGDIREKEWELNIPIPPLLAISF